MEQHDVVFRQYLNISDEIEVCISITEILPVSNKVFTTRRNIYSHFRRSTIEKGKGKKKKKKSSIGMILAGSSFHMFQVQCTSVSIVAIHLNRITSQQIHYFMTHFSLVLLLLLPIIYLRTYSLQTMMMTFCLGNFSKNLASTTPQHLFLSKG